jgi:hypothetical protein
MSSPTSQSPRKFQLSIRGLMATIAVISLLLAMFISTAAMRVDWKNPRIDDLVATASWTLGEAIFLYYIILAAVIGWGLTNPATRGGKLTRVYHYAPLLAIIALVALLEALDRLWK